LCTPASRVSGEWDLADLKTADMAWAAITDGSKTRGQGGVRSEVSLAVPL